MSKALNLHLVGDVALTGRSDPLINALTERLPPAGTSWPAAQRSAWLALMRQAFTVVYGEAEQPAPAAAPAAKRKGKPEKSAAAARVLHDFIIDKEGFARRGSGERVMPAEVVGYIVDERGENGDLRKIVWADDSCGIPQGMQLDITGG